MIYFLLSAGLVLLVVTIIELWEEHEGEKRSAELLEKYYQFMSGWENKP